MQDLTPMHILTPLNVTLDVYKCIVSDTNLPKYDYCSIVSQSFTHFITLIFVIWSASVELFNKLSVLFMQF